MDNPKKLATLGTHDTGQRLEKTERAIKNGQFRETGNIGYTRHKMKTNKTKNTTRYVLDTANTQPNTNNVNQSFPDNGTNSSQTM